nr:uncharacterized protein LOC123756209 [Procambarus clarkii]
MCVFASVLRAVVATCILGSALVLASPQPQQHTECQLPETGVYVSISAEAEFVNNGSEAIRWLEVNWYGVNDGQDGDWVGLWDHDPVEALSNPLAQSPASGADGVLRTEERWDSTLIPSSLDGITDSCLPYWVGYVRDEVLLYSACLMVRPRWLSALKSQLSATRLTKVALPGTHDAGASGLFGLAIIGELVGRWTFAQDESLWQQLVLGVRYMDMRISYYPQTEEKFFVNHGDVRIAPLQGYIDNVVAFMKQTDEIVIFDIHSLEPGFDGYPERHRELITLLESSFIDWMVPKDLAPDPTMGVLWENEFRLIVTYPTSEGSLSSYLWNNVHHLWGNVDDLSDLEAYLYTGIPQESDRGSLWSAMAQLTPSVLDVTINRWGGLRGAATITNAPVTRWFRQDWWDQVNIVAMDFMPASDVVSVAVEANKMRSQCDGRSRDSPDGAKHWWSTAGAQTVNLPGSLDQTVCADLVGAGGVGVRVWPTIRASPQRHANKLQSRLLQINWDAEEIQGGDWVGVFQQDPRPPHTRPPPTTPTTPAPAPHRFWQMPRPLHWDTPYASRGTITTNITQPRVELSVLARGGCVGLYVGFTRNGVCVASECIAAHPSWLFDNRQVVGNRSLRSLVLPGTHNAGSYSLRDSEDVVSAWVVCQDEDIVSQLLYGNRYLDLRVAYYPDTSELLWINHDLVRWRPLLEVLNAVRGFLAISPDPVIIDVHRTPVGFELPEAKPLLLSLMNETLGSHFLHNRYGSLVSLDQIWKIGKRVIFSFADADAADKQDWVWPPLPQAWANAQMLEDLRTYLDAQMNKRVGSPRLWAAMAHLTPTLWDMILRSHVGIRGLADRVNFPISRWLRQRWAHMANIIASDFFRGNDIINVAIRTNLALSVCRPPQTRRPVVPVVAVTPQRHPVTFRRSTGFRIVAETRRPVYSEITTQPMTSSTTTALPSLWSHSPASSEDGLPGSSTSPTVAVHEGTKYNRNLSNDSTFKAANAQSDAATESSLHPLIRILASPTDSATFRSAENAGQHESNQWSDFGDYTGVAYETSEELLYISEPKRNIYDPASEQASTVESQGPTVEPLPASIELLPAFASIYFNAGPVKPLNETASHSEGDNAGGWYAETEQNTTTSAITKENARGEGRHLDISEKHYLPSTDEDREMQAHPFNLTVESYVGIPSTTSVDQTMQNAETRISSITRDSDQSTRTPDLDTSLSIRNVSHNVTNHLQVQEINSSSQPLLEINNTTSVSVDIRKDNSTITHLPDNSSTQIQSLEHLLTPNFFLEHFSAQTPEHLSTQTSEHLSTQTPEHLSTQTTEHLSTQTTEHLSTQTTEHLSTQTTEHLSTQTTEHLSHTNVRTPLSTQTTEHLSTQTTEHLSTQTPEHLSTQTTEHLSTQTTEHLSTQTTEHLSTQTTEHLSTQTTEHLSTQTSEHLSTQTTEHLSTQTPEHLSTQTTEHLSTQTTEHLSTQTPEHLSTQTTEHLSTQTPHHFSTQIQHFSSETSEHFSSTDKSTAASSSQQHATVSTTRTINSSDAS